MDILSEREADGKILIKTAEILTKRGFCAYQLQDFEGRVCLMGAMSYALGNPGAQWGHHKVDPYSHSATKRLKALFLEGGQGCIASWFNNEVSCNRGEAAVEHVRQVGKDLLNSEG